MAKYSLMKTIEVQKLNKRTGVPTTDPPATVPFGAIIDNVEPDGAMRRFTFLGELYRCPADVLAAALDKPAAPQPAPPAVQDPAPAASPAAEAKAPRQAPGLLWEEVPSSHGPLLRAEVPGGRLLAYNAGLAFYPDPAHQWGSTSFPQK